MSDDMHTQTSTNGHGPDYCYECSDRIKEWVQWPCPAVAHKPERCHHAMTDDGSFVIQPPKEPTNG